MAFEPVTVSRFVELKTGVPDVWSVVGDFNGMHIWHPLIRQTTGETFGGEIYRHLMTVEGSEITERLMEKTDHSYRYAMTDTPLPVMEYEAEISVDAEGEGSLVTWTGSFVPTEETGEDIIVEIYEAGLNALRDRFGGA